METGNRPGNTEETLPKEKKSAAKKIIAVIIAVVIVIAAAAAAAFLLRSYSKNDDGYTLKKYRNTGNETDVSFDYVNGDESKPITVIEEYALKDNNVVKTINIGKDVEKIEACAFYNCTALQSITVDEENKYFCSDDGVLYNKDKTELIQYPIDRDQYVRDQFGLEDQGEKDLSEYDSNYKTDVLTYKVALTTEKIDDYAFASSQLAVVKLSKSVVTIGEGAFYNCTNLAQIISTDEETSNYSLSEGLEYIGDKAFSGDAKIDFLRIPSTVTHIGKNAFTGLSGIDTINIVLSEKAFTANVDAGTNWHDENVKLNYGAVKV